MSFTTLTSTLRSVWRRPSRPLVKLPQNAVKLYERAPPAWARWALVLVTVDVMVATSAVDVIWNAWTMPDPNLEGKPVVVPTEDKSNKLSKLQIIPPGHVLVPAWKRALSGSIFILSGIIVAATILTTRSRVVRGVTYFRTPGKPPSVYVQTASHPMRLGNSYAVKDCSLTPLNEVQLMLEIKDQGKWVLDMRGAKIANKPVQDRTLARSTMLRTWKDVGGPAKAFP